MSTVADALARYIAACEADGISKGELSCKRQNVQWFAAEAGWSHLTDITAASITEAKLGLTGRSSGTVRKYLIRLSCFLDFCIENGWIRTNPAKNVRKPRHVKQEGVRALSAGEVSRLVAKSPQPRRAYYVAASETGLRVGECERLEVRHVQLRGERPSLELTGDITKNKKPASIPLSRRACGAFASLIPPGAQPADKVFASIPTARTFDRDLARAGIPKRDERGRVAGRHSLRYHLATRLESAGTDPTVIQQIMRHGKLEITRGYMDDRLMRLAERAVSALNGGQAGVYAENIHENKPTSLDGLGTNADIAPVRVSDGSDPQAAKPVDHGSEADGNRTRNLRIDSPMASELPHLDTRTPATAEGDGLSESERREIILALAKLINGARF